MNEEVLNNLYSLLEVLRKQESQIVAKFYRDREAGVYSKDCALEDAVRPAGHPILLEVMVAQANVLHSITLIETAPKSNASDNAEAPDDTCFGRPPYHHACLVKFKEHLAHRVGTVDRRPTNVWLEGSMIVNRFNLEWVANHYEFDKLWVGACVVKAEAENKTVYVNRTTKELRIL